MKLTMGESLVLLVLLCTTNDSSKAKENVKNTLEKHNEEGLVVCNNCSFTLFMTSFNCDMSSAIQALPIRPSWLQFVCNLLPMLVALHSTPFGHSLSGWVVAVICHF